MSATSSTPPAPDPDRTPNRARLLEELTAELTSHTPAGMMRFMRRWPTGPLSLVHLHVLTVLDDEGPLPMRVLAESLDVSQASATGIVDRMEQRGLVERRRDDEDRRVIRVATTDDGRQLIAGVAAERRERLGYLLDQLTDGELEGFLNGSRALRRAREHLHELIAAGKLSLNGLDPHATPGPAVGGPHHPNHHPASVRPDQEASR